jgi:hypothetical protein
MLSWRTPGVREILLAFLLLSAVEIALLGLVPGVGPHKSAKISILWALFLTWRVSRGGRISHAFLLLGVGAGYLKMILSVARFWNPLLAVLAAAFVLQFLLLTGPQVSARLERQTERASWASVVPVLRRPPAWLVLGGLLAGVLITLVALGHGDWVAVPGCHPAASSACTGVAEGYPLPWLTAAANTPVIDKLALFKDFVQWTLVAWSALYALCYWMLPAPYREAQTSDAATFA